MGQLGGKIVRCMTTPFERCHWLVNGGLPQLHFGCSEKTRHASIQLGAKWRSFQEPWLAKGVSGPWSSGVAFSRGWKNTGYSAAVAASPSVPSSKWLIPAPNNCFFSGKKRKNKRCPNSSGWGVLVASPPILSSQSIKMQQLVHRSFDKLLLGEGNDASQLLLTCRCGSKNRYPKWNLVSGNMDQNLRFPGGLILTHTLMLFGFPQKQLAASTSKPLLLGRFLGFERGKKQLLGGVLVGWKVSSSKNKAGSDRHIGQTRQQCTDAPLLQPWVGLQPGFP